VQKKQEIARLPARLRRSDGYLFLPELTGQAGGQVGLETNE